MADQASMGLMELVKIWNSKNNQLNKPLLEGKPGVRGEKVILTLNLLLTQLLGRRRRARS